MSEFITTNPQSNQRRSQLYHLQQRLGAQFAAFKEAVVVEHFTTPQEEQAQLKALAIADLSTLPRTGFKGRETVAWLSDQGVDIPPAPNTAMKQQDGSIVARLSLQEHLILSDFSINSDLAARLSKGWSIQSDLACYALPRSDSHAWLFLSGLHLRAMLAKVCGIDLAESAFANLAIAQTSIARINGILIRDDLILEEDAAVIPGFHLLCDSSAVEFIWHSLEDAMAEFEGKAIGLAALLER